MTHPTSKVPRRIQDVNQLALKSKFSEKIEKRCKLNKTLNYNTSLFFVLSPNELENAQMSQSVKNKQFTF